MDSRRRFRGQGMTEYIIIVALIAIAAIGVYTAFGKTLRGQQEIEAGRSPRGSLLPPRNETDNRVSLPARVGSLSVWS